MRAPTTGTLRVPGANLYYEVRGSGPLLLLVPTGNGDAGPFRGLASLLADRYTVLSYDRRGHSRSTLDEPIDPDKQLEVDVEDVVSLLDHFGDGPSDVYATCSGGTIAVAMMERYPNRVRTMVVHEPPLISILPDADTELAFHAELHQIFVEHGIDAAKDRFRAYLGTNGATKPPDEFQPPEDELKEMLGRIGVNLTLWFTHELRNFPWVRPDFDALGAVADRLVLAGGTDSPKGQSSYRANEILAERLGLPLVHFPGGHVGHVTHPVEFAAQLTEVLESGARAAR